MEIGINAFAFEQVEVRSHFSDLALRHRDDDVGLLNGG